MPSPCSLDLTRLLSYSTLLMVRHAIQCTRSCKNRIIIFNCRAHQSLNDFATSTGSWHVRSRRKTSCTSISEQVLIYTISLYSRSRSVCRASLLRRIDVKREMPGSTSYLYTTFLFAQRTHEGRRLSHYFAVRAHHPDMGCKQLTRLCFLPLKRNTSDTNLGPLEKCIIALTPHSVSSELRPRLLPR